MKISVIKIDKNKENVLINLMEKYEYEFSQYHGWDVEESGLYEIEIEEEYWEDNEKYAAYLIEADGQLAGFVMVADGAEEDGYKDFIMDEFFVMHKYRGLGIGRKALFEVLDKHRGSWQMTLHPKNITAAKFWEKVIGEYTGGKYQIIKGHPHPDHSYEDDTAGDVMVFDNTETRL